MPCQLDATHGARPEHESENTMYSTVCMGGNGRGLSVAASNRGLQQNLIRGGGRENVVGPFNAEFMFRGHLEPVVGFFHDRAHSHLTSLHPALCYCTQGPR